VELIRLPEELRRIADADREKGASVGLVPTMGSLHEGHDALLGRAREERDLLVVSIFVNPLQFGNEQDFAAYPRDEAVDLARCEARGVDVVWAPTVEAMFPSGVALPSPDPGPLGSRLEGASRPGHFVGVLKVVRRLLDVTGTCAAYFGQKDAQQLFLVHEMVKQLDYQIDIVGCPTVREADGTARSSRNALLGPDERAQAGRLFLGLSEAAALARAGERDANVLLASVAREVGAASLARLDYVALVDEATFEPVESLVPGRPARALVAARFPSARLIDNLLLPEPGPRS
jgi:pantoate--beta-alanine ligase